MLQDFISYFRQENVEITSGRISKSIISLAVPMFLEMVMATVFSVVDMVWVGRLGAEAIAAVSISGVILMLVFSFVVGLNVSASAMVARRIGENAEKQANIILVHSLVLAGLLGIFHLLLSSYSEEMLLFMQVDKNVINIGREYLRISFFAGSIGVFLFSINAIFRGAGHALEAMLILGVSNAVNIVLDPVLIFGVGFIPPFGIKGAAIGTLFSQAIGVIIQVYLLFSRKLKVKLPANKARLRSSIFKIMIFIAIPASIQLFARIASSFALMKLVGQYGTYAIAAYGIGLTITRLVIIPGLGVGNAASTVVGQNIGAGEIERARESAWLAGKYNMLVMGSMGVVIALFSEGIVRLFTSDQEVINIGVSCVKITALSFGFSGFGIVMSKSLMGAGDTVSPMLINFMSLWVIQLPLAYILSKHCGMGTDGIWVAISFSNCIAALMGTCHFKAGKWKSKKVFA